MARLAWGFTSADPVFSLWFSVALFKTKEVGLQGRLTIQGRLLALLSHTGQTQVSPIPQASQHFDNIAFPTSQQSSSNHTRVWVSPACPAYLRERASCWWESSRVRCLTHPVSLTPYKPCRDITVPISQMGRLKIHEGESDFELRCFWSMGQCSFLSSRQPQLPPWFLNSWRHIKNNLFCFSSRLRVS